MASASVTFSAPSSPAISVPEPQTRGFLLPLPSHFTQADLEQQVERAANAGFNLLVFPIFTGGWTTFPSASQRASGVPALNPRFKRWNPLERVTRMAKAANLSVWGLARPYDFQTAKDDVPSRLLHKNPTWRMQRYSPPGEVHTRHKEIQHPCPLQQGLKGRRLYRHVLADLLSEAVDGYSLDGLQLDCTGFGLCGGVLKASPYCFCDNCRNRYFERYKTLLSEDMRSNNPIRARLWQQEQAQEHLDYLRTRLLRTRRRTRIVCQARPHWREQHDYIPARDGGALLDWPQMLADGEIEEVIVDYDNEPLGPGFGSRIAADFAYLGDQVLFMPILPVNHPGELKEPMRVLSHYTVPGFLADFAEPLSEAAMIELASTIFTEPAPLPESEPIRAAMFYLERVRQAHEQQPKLHDLMSDLLRLLARQHPEPKDFSTLNVLEQNLRGAEQFIRRGRLESRIPESTLRNLGLARRFVRMSLMDVRS